jgi:hypothetical protein
MQASMKKELGVFCRDFVVPSGLSPLFLFGILELQISKQYSPRSLEVIKLGLTNRVLQLREVRR